VCLSLCAEILPKILLRSGITDPKRLKLCCNWGLYFKISLSLAPMGLMRRILQTRHNS
jgi:hypothetical protein